MTTSCVLLDDYQGVATTFADWSTLDDVELTSVREHLPDEDAVVDAVADAEIVVLMRERTPFPATLLARLPHLRLLVTTGMRNASVDVAAATRLGVTVCGTPSSSTPPVELTWALILGLLRNLVPESTTLRSGGPWQSTVGRDLDGATLGVVGLGKIGSRVATIGQAFGMDVVAWSPNLTDERAAAVGVRRADRLPDLLSQSDVVTLHLPASMCTTRNRCPRATRCGRRPACSAHPTSATSPKATTGPTSPAWSRTSRPGRPATRSAGWVDRTPRHSD